MVLMQLFINLHTDEPRPVIADPREGRFGAVGEANRGGDGWHAGVEQLGKLTVAEVHDVLSGDDQTIVLGQIVGTSWPPHCVK